MCMAWLMHACDMICSYKFFMTLSNMFDMITRGITDLIRDHDSFHTCGLIYCFMTHSYRCDMTTNLHTYDTIEFISSTRLIHTRLLNRKRSMSLAANLSSDCLPCSEFICIHDIMAHSLQGPRLFHYGVVKTPFSHHLSHTHAYTRIHKHSHTHNSTWSMCTKCMRKRAHYGSNYANTPLP